MTDLETLETIDVDLDEVSGGAGGDYPGFTNCGPMLFSKGCIDGGMNMSEWWAVSHGDKMVTGQKASFKNWANWMRSNNYPSSALDKVGWPKR